MIDITRIVYVTKTIPQLFGAYWGSVCQKDNRIYVIGGKDSNNSDKLDICYYDINDNFATKHTCNARLSYSAYDPGLAVVGDYIYIFGGDWMTSYTSYGSRNYIYKYNTSTDTISLLSVRLSPARCEMATVVYGTKIYLIGGGSSVSMTSSNVINVFDTSTDTFDTNLTLPVSCAAPGAARNGTNIYILGGINRGPWTYNCDIYKLDLLNNSITIAKTLSSSYKIARARCFFEDGIMYSLNTYNYTSSGKRYNFAYNPPVNTFSEYETDSTARCIGVAVYNGITYVVFNTSINTIFIPGSISIGNLPLQKIYCGQLEVQKVYIGDKLLYQTSASGYTVSGTSDTTYAKYSSDNGTTWTSIPNGGFTLPAMATFKLQLDPPTDYLMRASSTQLGLNLPLYEGGAMSDNYTLTQNIIDLTIHGEWD